VTVVVHHRLEGPADGPVLVFSNSLGTTSEMWDDQAAALSERFRVLRYDTRGHGASPVPPGPYAIADLGRDVIELLDRLGIERASFCGLSIGGMTGMWLGAHAPQRLDRLVLCCTAPWLPPREQWVERAATFRAQGTGAVADAALERWFRPAFAGRDPERLERIRRTLLATPAEGYAACCEAIGELDLRAELADVRSPTLVIAGADDPVGTPEIARDMAAAIPDARLVVVPEARHLANIEQPETVTRALMEHLDAKVSA
jgi:3-oxoadipate enol-lactonase